MWWLTLAFAGTFDDADKASGTEDKLTALFEITDDEALADDHGEAWRRIGDALAGANDPAAIIAYGKAFSAGDADKAVEAMKIADRIGDHAVVAEPLSTVSGFKAKGDDDKSWVAYLVARDLLRRDKLGPTLDWVKKVDNDAPAFADAEILRGVVLANQGKNEKALAPFQTARALGTTQERGERFDTKVLINIARAYYGSRNWGQAIYHYKQVPRDSDYWPEAHFEQAWSHFMGADMGGTLGLLHSHGSPFMAELWFPEGDMLRTQALFMTCKFATAVEEMDKFEKRYQPVRESLDGSLAKMNADKAFDQVGTYLDGGSTDIPGIVLRRYRSEDRIQESIEAVSAYESAKPSNVGKHEKRIAGWLDARAKAIQKLEGRRVLTRAEGQRDEIAKMLTDLELARVDILQLESRLYERAAATGELADVTAENVGRLRELHKTKKGFHVWPFQGEYWADELGWYSIDARSDCPESLARKIGG